MFIFAINDISNLVFTIVYNKLTLIVKSATINLNIFKQKVKVMKSV